MIAEGERPNVMETSPVKHASIIIKVCGQVNSPVESHSIHTLLSANVV